MKKTKKIVAVAAAMAMALAPTYAYADPAATGEAASTGGLEGAVVKDYVDYVAPTQGDNSFDFLLDPQELIASTDGTSLQGGTVVTEAGVTVYFKNTAAGGYAASSDALTVINKSSSTITVSATASMTLDATGSSINVVAADEVTASGLNLNIHLDQVSSDGVTVVKTADLTADSDVATQSALTLDAAAAGADEDQFEIVKSGGDYSYEPISGDVSGESVSFVFKGACNPDADWTTVKGMSAQFDVVWNVESGGTTEIYAAPYGTSFFAGLDNVSPFPEGFPSDAKLSDLSAVTFTNQSTGEVYDGLELGLVSFDSTTVQGKTYLKINAGNKSNVTWTLDFTYLGRSYTSELEY